jgi:hypothetical protein
MRLYINSNNQQIGPISDEEALSGLASGRFTPNDLCIREGEAHWRPLGEMFPQPPDVQSKKGGCGRIVLWGLLLLGCLLILIGAYFGWRSQAALNNSSSLMGCSDADRAKAEAEAVFAQLQARHLDNVRLNDPIAISRLSNEDRALLKSWDDKRYSMDLWEDLCANFVAGYRRWRLIGIIVAFAGLVAAIVGGLSLRVRR